MKDLIVYCPNSQAFDNEVQSLDEGFVYQNHTPLVYSQDKSKWVTLVRLVPAQQDKDVPAKSIEVLGTKDEVDADPVKTAKYLECYSRAPYKVTLEDGSEAEVTPPYWHGEFAA